MIENAIPQHFIWYDAENDIVQERLVEQEEELLWMFQDLFKSRPTDRPGELVEAYLAWQGGRPVESALYLTVSDQPELENSGLARNRIEVMDLRRDSSDQEVE